LSWLIGLKRLVTASSGSAKSRMGSVVAWKGLESAGPQHKATGGENRLLIAKEKMTKRWGDPAFERQQQALPRTFYVGATEHRTVLVCKEDTRRWPGTGTTVLEDRTGKPNKPAQVLGRWLEAGAKTAESSREWTRTAQGSSTSSTKRRQKQGNQTGRAMGGGKRAGN
jgi:hypothetical protein